jgi:hypothetical protein
MVLMTRTYLDPLPFWIRSYAVLRIRIRIKVKFQELWELKMGSRVGSVDKWPRIGIPLIKSRIQLRIRNQVKSRIQISIKVMGIRNSDLRSAFPILLIQIWPKRLSMTTYINELESFSSFLSMFFSKLVTFSIAPEKATWPGNRSARTKSNGPVTASLKRFLNWLSS